MRRPSESPFFFFLFFIFFGLLLIFLFVVSVQLRSVQSSRVGVRGASNQLLNTQR